MPVMALWPRRVWRVLVKIFERERSDFMEESVEPVVLVTMTIKKILLPTGSSVVEFNMEGGESISGMLGMLEYSKMLVAMGELVGDDDE